MHTRESALASSVLAGLSVLVVDDNEDTLALLTIVLEIYGAQVVTAGSAREALEAFVQAKPDVLVSDIGMAEGDGYSLIQKIRTLEAERGGQVPAIAFTGFAREYDRARSLAAGFQAHLTKPVEPEELVAAVADLARRC